MPLALDIALTHLRSRKRQTLVSVLGVAMGVGFFVAITALMQGFQQDFVRRVNDNSPHITMKDEYREPPRQPAEIVYAGGAIKLRGVKPKTEIRGIRRAGQIMEAVRAWQGLTVSQVLQGQGFLRYGSKERSATITGIEPDRERLVTKLDKDIVAGSVDALKTTANGIILGKGLATRLAVGLGDNINVTSPTGVIMLMKVVGLSHTGVIAFDDVNAYVLLKKNQILQGKTNIVNQIRMRTDDVNAARALAAKIEARFGYRTESWDEANEGVFGIFVIQNMIMYSVTGAILVVACFGIFNIISTVIFEKTRDIAILKSIGFAERDIRAIFLLEGLALGVIGAGLGCALGLGLTYLLSIVRFHATGLVEVQKFILKWSIWHYAIASSIAMVSAMAAAYLPSRRAAKVNPVEIVRGAA
ncbi:MAG: ABC transporter permease [Rhodospirillaceae bacterium]|nr:ABC transporter permease [Rhodospirillaceae bacterium]